jgi:type IV pilus assembly protein PilV
MIIKRSNEGLRVRQREQGMTLIELMMAMVVLAVGLGGLCVMFTTAIQTNNKNAKDTTATMLAQLVLEEISAQPANTATNFTVADCANNQFTVSTAGAAGPTGKGATLMATGRIDQTQAYNAVPANYGMQYVACGTGTRRAIYDVRWNVITLTPQTRLITVSSRQSQGTGVGRLGGLVYAMPVTLRGIGGM